MLRYRRIHFTCLETGKIVGHIMSLKNYSLDICTARRFRSLHWLQVTKFWDGLIYSIITISSAWNFTLFWFKDNYNAIKWLAFTYDHVKLYLFTILLIGIMVDFNYFLWQVMVFVSPHTCVWEITRCLCFSVKLLGSILCMHSNIANSPKFFTKFTKDTFLALYIHQYFILSGFKMVDNHIHMNCYFICLLNYNSLVSHDVEHFMKYI